MKTEAMLKKYFRKRTNAIDSFLKKPSKAFNPEIFHKLRVEIKKLKAFFELVNFCSKDFKRKKTFRPFKDLFVQAGRVRELQLEEAALKKYATLNSLGDYIHNLKTFRLKKRKDFFSLIDKKFITRTKKNHARIIPFLMKADKKRVSDFLDKKKKKIEFLFKRKNLNPDNIHELRKRLKEFYYIRKCVNLKGQNKSLKKMDDFQEVLGKWHDCIVMEGHLKKAIDKGGMKPAEIKPLQKMKAKFSSDGKLLFKHITVTIQRHQSNKENSAWI